MQQAEEPRKTPLYHWHLARGANMATFSGWSMPLWYPSGAVAENQIVVTAAGVFDTSHMSVVTVAGPGAFEVLQLCFTKDLDRCVGRTGTALYPGKCVYGAFLNEKGHVLDDAIVYQIAHDRYMIVVNAGTGPVIAGHLKSHAHGSNVEITDLTDKVGKIDLQGPASARVMMKLLKNPSDALKDMRYFSFRGHFDEGSASADTFLTDGTPIMLSRTGYTGEFGFELFMLPGRLVDVWEAILRAGTAFGVIPCGLAARDALRVGAVLPLSHQDIGPWPFINHPWEFALPYTPDGNGFTKKFVGDTILSVKHCSEHTHAFVGYDPRKVSTRDPAVVLDSQGNEVGVVLTCVAEMSIGLHDGRIYSMASPGKPRDFKPRGLSCGFVKVKSRLVPGQELELKDNRRRIKVVIVDDVRPDRTARYPIQALME